MVNCKDGGLWTHGTVVGRGDCNHNNRSYLICITKTGQIVTKQETYQSNTHNSTKIPLGYTKQKQCRYTSQHLKTL